MRERERKQDALVSICLDRGKREKPQNGSEKKKSRHQRALSTTTQTTPPPANERRSRAKTLRVSSKSARSVRVPPSRKSQTRVIIFARTTVSLTCAKALRTRRKSLREERKREKQKVYIRERAFTSFSLDSRANEIRSLVSNEQKFRERERPREGYATRETYHDEF